METANALMPLYAIAIFACKTDPRHPYREPRLGVSSGPLYAPDLATAEAFAEAAALIKFPPQADWKGHCYEVGLVPELVLEQAAMEAGYVLAKKKKER